MNVPDISRKINRLYSALKADAASTDELAGEINSILLDGEKVPRQVLASAWDLFATKKGVKK